MRFGTYNVHGWADRWGDDNRGRVVEVLRAMDCDVIALQEAYVDDAEFPEGGELDDPDGTPFDFIEQELRVRAVWSNAAHGLANALLLREPFHSVRKVDLLAPGAEWRSAVTAVIDTPWGETTVCATHLDHLSERARLKQLQTLDGALADEPAIIMGDFNALRGSDYPAGRLEEIKWARMRAYIEPFEEQVVLEADRLGWVDLARWVGCQNLREYRAGLRSQLPAWARETSAYDTRVDYLWARRPLVRHIRAVDLHVLDEDASDHKPVVVELVRNPKVAALKLRVAPRRPNPPTRDARFTSLVGAFLNPSRARLAEVESIAQEHRGGARELWERLNARGILPDDWVEDPRRKFVREPMPKRAYNAEMDRRLLPCPDTIQGVITMASDVPGVLRAEEAAREWYARWSALDDLPPFQGIAWRVIAPHDASLWPDRDEDTTERGDALARGCLDLLEDLQRAGGKGIGRALATVRECARTPLLASVGSRPRPTPKKMWDSLSSDVWNVCTIEVAQRFRVKPGEFHLWSKVRADTSLDTVRNPESPKLDVYAAGYAVHGMYTFRRLSGWVVLIATPVDAARLPKRSRQRKRR